MLISIPPFAFTRQRSLRQEDTKHVLKSYDVLVLQARFTRKLFREHLDHELFLNFIQFL
jgi:hypothetical protein